MSKAKENPGSAGPEATGKEPAPWDRMCKVCGSKTLQLSAEVFDQEDFECSNMKCRATFRVQTFYGAGGIFLGEQFKGMMEGPLHG